MRQSSRICHDLHLSSSWDLQYGLDASKSNRREVRRTRTNAVPWPARRGFVGLLYGPGGEGGLVELIALHTYNFLYTQSHLGMTLRQLVLPSGFLEDTSQSHQVGDARDDSVGTAMHTGLFSGESEHHESQARDLVGGGGVKARRDSADEGSTGSMVKPH